eukprot:scaffold31084_cov37-Cyclotella_meneghiniana.AAC.2
MRRLISKCNSQRLLPWTCILKQCDKRECINRIGYEHGRVLCLICTRLQMIQRTGTALELTALLRRCSYPKRDEIRWGSVKSEEWQYLSLEDIPTHLSLICPGAFNKTLIPNYCGPAKPPISVGTDRPVKPHCQSKQ